MRREQRSKSGRGNGPSQPLLLRRVDKYKGNVEDVVKSLKLRYPEYQRYNDTLLIDTVNKALSTKFKRNVVATGKQSTSSSSSHYESSSVLVSSGGEVSSPQNFDFMKSMLRDSLMNKRELASREVMEKKQADQEEEEEEDSAMKDDVIMAQGPDTSLLKTGRPMFRDFGGMGKVLDELKYNVLIPLRYPELFDRLNQLNAGPPTGILLHGPPGCGKTMLAQAIANEAGVPFYPIEAPEIVSGVSGQSEENIRELFMKARKTAPSIIFIDEIDGIAGKRENMQKGMEGRIVIQLLKCMDNMNEFTSCKPSSPAASEFAGSECRPGHVLVIGATNRPDSLDSALRRPGRFSWEIELGVPDENARLEILTVLTRDIGVQDLDLRRMARDTQGFLGADLKDYLRKASLCAMQRMINLKKSECMAECSEIQNTGDWWKQLSLRREEVQTLSPTVFDFEVSLKCVQPSLKREGFSKVPNVKWEDVGGFDSIRQELQSCIVKPIKHPEVFEAFKDDLPGGFLLYGPPGCGKTLIAKAVANEAGVAFRYIKGPELLSKYVGDSELAVRKIFKDARTSSPCILFFDELDGLTANRGESSGANVKVLQQLLVELDGEEERRGVYVIGATNRPDLIDHALLRPGRFEELIYIPLPNGDERVSILKTLARKKPIDDAVDLPDIAKNRCESFSGADLAKLMKRASRIARDEMLASRDRGSNAIPCTINFGHFEKALVGLTPSVNAQQRNKYNELSKRFSAA